MYTLVDMEAVIQGLDTGCLKSLLSIKFSEHCSLTRFSYKRLQKVHIFFGVDWTDIVSPQHMAQCQRHLHHS